MKKRVTDLRLAPRRSQDEILRAQLGYVRRVAARFGAAPSELDDVAQEVALILMRDLDRWQDDTTLSTLLFTITRRQTAALLRRRWRKMELVTDEVPEVTCEPPQEAKLLRDAERARVRRAVNALDVPKREALVGLLLRRGEVAEVARRLDCPPKTLYSRARAARKQMRRLLAHEALQASASAVA